LAINITITIDSQKPVAILVPMSFPNPDNYARDCDCGTAGANTTPPPATIQAEIDSLDTSVTALDTSVTALDTRVTALEETNDVIVSSGGIANLTTAQQALIREGSIVVTTDGKRWVYSGAGSKVLEASYIELSDLTIGSTANLPLITGTSGVITAGSFGSSANTFCQGNDSRLSDARTPLSHTHGNISNGGLIGTTANLPIITGTGGLLQAGSFGTTTNTFCQGDDSRLSNARTPTAHTHPASEISDSTTAGRDLLTAATVQAQRTALDILVSAANLAAFPASGNFQRVYLALDTAKTYVWNGTGYTEVSPNAHARAGAGNINVGETALASASLSGSNNSAVGANALTLNTSGGNNSAFGVSALSNNLIGNFNTAVGVNALQLSNADNNTAFGSNALKSNLTGVNNVAVGISALQACDSYNNTSIGQGSLFACTSGHSNSALGLNAGLTLQSGYQNTLLGTQSDVDAQGRDMCVVIGSGAISPAVDGSLAIGGTGGNAMGNLVTTSGGTSASQDLIIYLNGTRYRIALKT